MACSYHNIQTVVSNIQKGLMICHCPQEMELETSCKCGFRGTTPPVCSSELYHLPKLQYQFPVCAALLCSLAPSPTLASFACFASNLRCTMASLCRFTSSSDPFSTTTFSLENSRPHCNRSTNKINKHWKTCWFSSLGV